MDRQSGDRDALGRCLAFARSERIRSSALLAVTRSCPFESLPMDVARRICGSLVVAAFAYRPVTEDIPVRVHFEMYLAAGPVGVDVHPTAVVEWVGFFLPADS